MANEKPTLRAVKADNDRLSTQNRELFKELEKSRKARDGFKNNIQLFKKETKKYREEVSSLNRKVLTLEAKVAAFKKVLNNLDLPSDLWTTIIEEVIDRYV